MRRLAIQSIELIKTKIKIKIKARERRRRRRKAASRPHCRHQVKPRPNQPRPLSGSRTSSTLRRHKFFTYTFFTYTNSLPLSFSRISSTLHRHKKANCFLLLPPPPLQALALGGQTLKDLKGLDKLLSAKKGGGGGAGGGGHQRGLG
jgi:hypothetical protein